MTTSPRWRVALATAASAAALVATPLAGASTAYAQYGPLPPTLTVEPTTVAAGGTVTIHAENFPANTTLTETLHSNDGRTGNNGGNGGNRRSGSSGRSVRGGHDDHGGHNGGNGGNRGDGVFLGTVTTDATGAATDTVTIPVCTSPGYHFLEVESSRPHLEAWARIRVLAAANGGGDRCRDDGRGDHRRDDDGGRDEGRGDDGGRDEGRGDHGGRDEGRGQGGQSNQSMGGGESSGRDEFSGRNEASGRPGSDERNGARRQSALAATGSEKAMALGGTAAALVVLGGGTMMAMRRRRSS